MKQLFFIGLFVLLLGLTFKSFYKEKMLEISPKNIEVSKLEKRIDSISKMISYNFALANAIDKAAEASETKIINDILLLKRDSVNSVNDYLCFEKEILKDCILILDEGK